MVTNNTMKPPCIRALSLISLIVFSFVLPVGAFERLGTGNKSLLGGDLTDPEDTLVDREVYTADLPEEKLRPQNATWVNMYSEPVSDPRMQAHQRHAYQSWQNSPACAIFLNKPEQRGWYLDYKDGGNGGASEKEPFFCAVELKDAFVLTHFTITTTTHPADRDPLKWAIQGSNTGADDDWHDIYRCDATNRETSSLRATRVETTLFTSFDSEAMPKSVDEKNLKKLEAKLTDAKIAKIAKADFARPAKAYTWFRIVITQCFMKDTWAAAATGQQASFALGQVELFGVPGAKENVASKPRKPKTDPINYPVKLIPMPKTFKFNEGEMALTAESRIVATDAKLKPLAEILANEILTLTKVRLAPAEGEAKPGDIVLKINSALRADADIWACQNRNIVQTRDYAHTISVTDKAVIEGWDYRAVCEGTATILHALKIEGAKVSLPKMDIKDWPHADFTGIMIDCARQDMPITALKDAVMAARFWKVRYLHLHFLEDSAFVFPMKAFKSGTSNGACFNGDTPMVWDLEELKNLVAFADARGVTLVPEIETPGHASALLRDVPAISGGRLIDLIKPEVEPVLDKVIGEVCEVFKSSPFFHIGGDEIQFEGRPNILAYVKEHGLGDGTTVEPQNIKDALLKQFFLRVNEMVKKRGKKSIFWGGWQGPPQIPELNDCIIYSWFRGARQAQDAGFATITVPWDINDTFPNWNIYSSNEAKLKPTDRVLGGSRMMWEQSAETIVNRWLPVMAERQERTWGPKTVVFEPEFRGRMKICQERMNKLIRPVQIKEEVKVIDKVGERSYYSEPATVTMSADLPHGCSIRWTLDGSEPKPTSKKYESPLTLNGKLRIRGAVFDESGTMVGGITFGEKYDQIISQKNLTTGKPVTASSVEAKGTKEALLAEFAADGFVGRIAAIPDGTIPMVWAALKPPQWWQVDLLDVVKIDRIEVIPWPEGGRSFQYTVEVTTDQKTWTKVVDESANTKPETGEGHMHKIEPINARFVRVNMLKNSVADNVQLDEVRVFEAGKP